MESYEPDTISRVFSCSYSEKEGFLASISLGVPMRRSHQIELLRWGLLYGLDFGFIIRATLAESFYP